MRRSAINRVGTGAVAIGIAAMSAACGSSTGGSALREGERSIPVGGAVVAWVGSGATREAVSVGLSVTVVTRGATPPTAELLAPVFQRAQWWIEQSFTSAHELALSRRNSPEALVTEAGLELRDPRFRVAAVRLPWIVRGTSVALTPELCPRAEQRIGSLERLGARGAYLCFPLTPPLAPKPAAAAPRASHPETAGPSQRRAAATPADTASAGLRRGR